MFKGVNVLCPVFWRLADWLWIVVLMWWVMHHRVPVLSSMDCGDCTDCCHLVIGTPEV
jgi:hypothetical protein